ncbi:MAG: radical SAM protein [Kiritimatiellaeota bacterium]|nr:radical SAM protein [Kiritimatiellota bacterium]
MNTIDKLALLSDDSKYDLACSCGTNELDRRKKQPDGSWLYPVQLAAGGTGILFKTLMSNACSSDCKYCPLRHDGNARRCSLTPDETAEAFMAHNRKKWLLGTFLSSGITGSPDRAMQQLTDTAAILRHKHNYRGYIHLKIIPGASDSAIRYAMSLSSAVSLNIEVPGAKYFSELSQYKRFDEDIIRPIKLISELAKRGAEYSRVKCSTQFVVGAASEPDTDIVRYMGGIYDRLKFQRIYFSAYQPPTAPHEEPAAPFQIDDGEFHLDGGEITTNKSSNFQLSTLNSQLASPALARAMREHRLYQTDFLLRRYKFKPDEIMFGQNGNLSLESDPKRVWADAHPDYYPIHVNSADRDSLLRIPGIGPIQAERILEHRKNTRLREWLDIGFKGKNAAKAASYATFG